MKRTMMTLLALSLFALPTLTALSQPECDGPPPHRPPPREAIEACQDLKAGDRCSFEGPEGDEIQGACFTPDAEKPLACRPNHPPPGAREGKRGGSNQSRGGAR